MLTYEKQALSGTIEVLLRSELPDEFEGTKLYGSLEEDELRQDCKNFFGCQMKQGMDALQSIRFFLVLSFTITICTWDIAIKIKPQLKT